jgi:predicted RNA-binding protein YlqC (UPF0109 family)
MPEDIEWDTCNFLLMALESLIEIWGEPSVIPVVRSGSTIFQIELDPESLEHLLANDGRMLEALQILISARGMRHHRDFRIEFGGRFAGATGNPSGTS